MPAFLEDVIFPESISSSDFSGKYEFSTSVTVLGSGYEQRDVKWQEGRMRYDAGLVPRSASDWETIAALYRVVKGRGYGFRLKDAHDYTITSSNGKLVALQTSSLVIIGTTGYGYGVPKYQMLKVYTSGSYSSERTIRKPRSGTVTVYRNGSPVTAGASAGNYALDTATGIVTFVADSSSTVTAVTVGSTTQVTLTAALSGLIVGDRLYLSGLTGSGASALNNLSHPILAISTNTYTLNTNTSGLTITAAGSGYKYPKVTDTLTCAAEFDVPVRFDTDSLPFELAGVAKNKSLIIESGSIPLVEIKV